MFIVIHKPETDETILYPSTAVYKTLPAAEKEAIVRARTTGDKIIILHVHSVLEVETPPVTSRLPFTSVGKGAFTRSSAQLKDM